MIPHNPVNVNCGKRINLKSRNQVFVFTRAQTQFGHALAPQTLFGRLAETEFLGKYVPKLQFGNEAGLN
jgi:hypothetical protein